ncbi:MAG: AMP-binding protein [Marinifilaceae bacterium]|jgi:long-chain acyl-CoA synthetase|nr:AMP-binding protein [Marinifilaceae bacterium]
MQTIIDLFETSVEKYRDNPYVWEHNGSKYFSHSYIDIKNKVEVFAKALFISGIKKYDKIALLSEGRTEWLVSELAILYSGGINVPLSIKLDAETELKFRLVHSETRYIIVSGNQIEKIRSIINDLDNIEQVIILDSDCNTKNNKEIHIHDFLKLSEITPPEIEEEFKQIAKEIKKDDPANISYTSGTTADPKGIILTHGNYTTNTIQACGLMDIPEHYKTLLILPWDHSFAHTAGIYAFMYKGASIASVQQGKTALENLKNIPKNLNELKPDILLSVPALAKNFKAKIEAGIKKKGGFTEKLFNFALKLSYCYNSNGFSKGKGVRLILKPFVRLFDSIIFSKVRNGFGENLKFFIGGGALLDLDLQRFFYAIGIPMFQGYGLSEASPIISSNSINHHKLGSSGFLVEDMELKICDSEGNSLQPGEKGEIVIKGGNVMKAYWKNKSATDECLKNNWLHTGDMGYMDNDGYLYVLGRFKSLLISNDGEKYSPEAIEEAFVEQSNYIEKCVLYNNQNPYTTGLIVPNKNKLISELKKHNLNIDSSLGQERSLELIESDLNEFKQGKYKDMFPQRWIPASVLVCEEDFTEQNKLVNSTMKIVRNKVIQKYQADIEFLYTPESKNFINGKNKANIYRNMVN